MGQAVAVQVADFKARSAAVPWYIWVSVIGVTSAMIGGHWDISWHRSIGRDTFWTPAHLAIYLCGILAGVSSGYLILATTFGKLPDVAPASVRMWGFRGPLGAFITAWGGIAMLVSAPFDDWWHSAYGLDVKIVSPPHIVLIAGILGIQIGALILVLGRMNRTANDERRSLNRLFLYLGGMILVVLSVVIMEYTGRALHHTAFFYRIVAVVMLIALAGIARASGHPWGATILAAVYMVFTALLVWILPRFPAEPKLGPVFHPVTYFVPPEFPMLLIAPAFALDLLWRKMRDRNVWITAAASAAIFITVFMAVQWPFASFLMSPAAANPVFGTIYLDYSQGPDSYEARGAFVGTENVSRFAERMVWALGLAAVLARLGFAWGDWMRRVRR